MRKTILLAGVLLFSVSAQAQILDIIKSTVKDKTGVDLNNPVKTNTSTSTTTTTPTKSTSTSPINLGSLTSTQISSGLKEALNLGVTEGVKKLAVTATVWTHL